MFNSHATHRTGWPRLLTTVVSFLLLTASPWRALAQEDAGYEELTSGPIHEAYADVVQLEPSESTVIDREPPAPINELPPEQRPEGQRVEWLPGYWLWDVDREDFIWISGVYRNVPPNRRWVPGSWVEVEGGWQRVSGFWADVELTSVDYLPAPPETLETGPTSPAPSDNHFWVPGCWYWQANDYAWRPGYWSVAHTNWVWMPHRYVWTPRGCIWVNGYWDYLPPRRGLLFAPIFFRQPVFLQAGFYFRPGLVWNVSPFLANWFVRPFDCHYYYGNFYGPRFNNFGFMPWYAFNRTRGFYDPLYSWHRWDYRRQPHGRWNNWDDYVRDRHNYYRDNERARPPATFAELNLRQREGWRDEFQRGDRSHNANQLLASRLEDYRRGGSGNMRLERVSEQMRDQMSERNSRWRELQQQRSVTEGLASGRTPDERGPRGDGQRGPRAEGQPGGRGSWQLPEVFSPGERAARAARPTTNESGQQARLRELGDRSGRQQPFDSRTRQGTPGGEGPRRVETLRPSPQQGEGPTLNRPGVGNRSWPGVQRPQSQPGVGPSLRAPQIEQRLAPQRQPERGSSRPTPNLGRPSPNFQQPSARPSPGPQPGGSLRAPQIEQRIAPQRQSSPATRGGPLPNFNFNRGTPGGSSLQQRSGPSLQQRPAPSMQRSAPSLQRSAPSMQRSAPSMRSGSGPPSSRGGSFNPGRGGSSSIGAPRGGGGGSQPSARPGGGSGDGGRSGRSR